MEASSSSQQGVAAAPAAAMITEVPASHARSVAEVERLLGYSFRNKLLIAEALTHPTYKPQTGGVSTPLPNYDRLRAVGETALHQALADHFSAANHPRNIVADLVFHNTNYGQLFMVAHRHDLYSFLLRDAPPLDRWVADTYETMRQQEMGVKCILHVPNAVGDIVMAVAGAVYVDHNYDLKLFWEAFRGFLEPMVTADSLGPLLAELGGTVRANPEAARRAVRRANRALRGRPA